MISKVSLKDGRIGTLVHTIVRLDAGGTVLTAESGPLELVPSPLDYRVIVYKCFWSYMKRREISTFYKSVLWNEDYCIKMMFKATPIYQRALDEMCSLLILTKDAKRYKLGTAP